ncbi:MAG TPA: flagellar filament capping protein FliD [Nitrospinae bacterium]|nr:flagellar filament capping protein FliD [Nitrospinota bacterium]
MQVLNNTPPTFFPFNSSRTTSKNHAVNVARDTLNQVGNNSQNKSQTLFDAVFLNKRQVPQLEATGPLAAFRTADAIALLSQRSQSQKLPIIENLDKKQSFALARLRQLDGLTGSLKELQQTVADLENALNPKSASSSRFREVLAAAGKNAPLNSFDVRSVRLSRTAELVSDVKDPSQKLGLSGRFFINGVPITVVSTDSLFTIKNKINFGEDVNQNGTLDLSEDVDRNGTLGILQVANSEFGEGIFIKEDINGNGEIDPTEDSNSNKRLDGGSFENNVLALIRDNRLVLVSLAGGSNTIDLREDDSVLLGLGFFEIVNEGLSVQKEIQLNDLKTRENLIVQPQTAIVEVDGKFFSSNTDVVFGVIEDTALLLQQASEKSAKITVFIDAPIFFEQIKILFSQFNNSIAKINDLLAISNSFEGDGDIQDIRNDLTIDPQKQARVLQERNRIIDDLRGRPGNTQATGISVGNTEKKTQQEVAVTSIVKGIKSGLSFPSQNGGENLLKRLSSVGIRTLTDNTFAIDETEFKRGLEKNTLEVFDLFTNSETGILPLLTERLENIVLEGRGDLAIKQTKVIIQSGTPNILAENFRKFTENLNLGTTVQTLIAVA